jgi:hypothetical protein
MKKKTTRKKATKKRTVKKAAKRRKSTTKKSALARKIDDFNAVANKALRNAEEMSKKAKASKDSRIKRSYNYGAKQMTELATRAQRKAAELLKK